jgi:putative ABC transport system ATP-binding protein
MNEIISAANLTKIYRRGSEEIHALDDVSFNLIKGEFAVIAGPSGSGKTTLLNIIGCLDTPTSGNLMLNGTSVTGKKESSLVKIRRDNIGFVFQQFFLLPTLTIRENIELPLLFNRTNGHKQAIDEIIEMVGLKGRTEHLPHQLSGGEMQRAAIARALVNKPVILLADEPTGNLDSANAKIIFEIFNRLNAGGVTICVVTHNLEFANLANRQIRLKDGRIVS